jgi:sensitive to high expression protein 9
MAVDKAFTDLTSAILQRYHEEQVWSDKIRSVSTWANVIGLVFNFFIFVVAIAIVEPWKRRRLVERVEERMTGLMERVERQVEDVRSEIRANAVRPLSSPTPLPPVALPRSDTTPTLIGPAAPMSPISELLQKHLDVDYPLTPVQSHYITAALGALLGGCACLVMSGLST